MIKRETRVHAPLAAHEWQIVHSDKTFVFYSEADAKLFVESIRLVWPGQVGGVVKVEIRHVIRFNQPKARRKAT